MINLHNKKIRSETSSVLCLLAAVSITAVSTLADNSALTPFVLPWDDTSSTIVSAADMNSPIKDRWVRVSETGHLVLSEEVPVFSSTDIRSNPTVKEGERIRFTKKYVNSKKREKELLKIYIGAQDVDRILSGFEIVHSYTDLVALTILFHGDYIQTPGITYLAVRKLAWEHINIIEIVSTMNVLTFIVSREDSHRAYQALEAFLDEEL